MIERAEEALQGTYTTETILFGALVAFLVKKGVLNREEFITYLQIGTEGLARDEPFVAALLRKRIEILKTEEMDEVFGFDLQPAQEALRQRIAAEALRKRKQTASRKPPKEGSDPATPAAEGRTPAPNRRTRRDPPN